MDNITGYCKKYKNVKKGKILFLMLLCIFFFMALMSISYYIRDEWLIGLSLGLLLLFVSHVCAFLLGRLAQHENYMSLKQKHNICATENCKHWIKESEENTS